MDTVAMVGRVLVSLAAVLGLMWVMARRVRKVGGRAKDSRLIDVLGRQQLSRNASVAVVRVGEQALVIGVTDGQVSVLAETDLGAAQALVAANEPAARRPTRTSRSARAGHARPSSTPLRSIPDAGSPERAATHAHSALTSPAEAPASTTGTARRPLAGSALSPQTWRQTVESLREMTARST